MPGGTSNRTMRLLLGLIMIVLIAIAGYGFYLADLGGALPWQEDPTRIPVQPFEGIPGFNTPTPFPTATATVAP